MRILIVEDEKLLADSLKSLLVAKEFQVDVAYDGESGAEYALLGVYDLIILDTNVPKMNGIEVTRKLRACHCNAPILMLTSKSEVKDRIAGLNAGADYYLSKPFDKAELIASVSALLRRQGGQVNDMVYGNTTLNLDAAMLICEDREVRLTAKEFDIARMLYVSGANTLPKGTILSRVWGLETEQTDNHVEVYMVMLRKKLALIHSNLKIVCVRNLGYHLEVRK